MFRNNDNNHVHDNDDQLIIFVMITGTMTIIWFFDDSIGRNAGKAFTKSTQFASCFHFLL